MLLPPWAASMFVDRDVQAGVFSATHTEGTHFHDVLVTLLGGFADAVSNGDCRLRTPYPCLALGAWHYEHGLSRQEAMAGRFKASESEGRM